MDIFSTGLLISKFEKSQGSRSEPLYKLFRKLNDDSLVYFFEETGEVSCILLKCILVITLVSQSFGSGRETMHVQNHH